MKRRLNENKQILKLRDDLYVNILNIDSITLVDKHPTENTSFKEPKYLIWFMKNAHFSWALVTKEEFKINIEPFI